MELGDDLRDAKMLARGAAGRAAPADRLVDSRSRHVHAEPT